MNTLDPFATIARLPWRLLSKQEKMVLRASRRPGRRKEPTLAQSSGLPDWTAVDARCRRRARWREKAKARQ